MYWRNVSFGDNSNKICTVDIRMNKGTVDEMSRMRYSWLSLSRIRWDHGKNSSQP
jgi:hypothetical protein